jgi:hypothetical protein
MDPSKKVFRLRELPATVKTKEGAACLLSERLGNVPLANVWVRSLATTMNVYGPSTKVATVTFSVMPSLISQSDPDQEEWNIPARDYGSDSPDFILDAHFMGLTPLNDTGDSQPSYE